MKRVLSGILLVVLMLTIVGCDVSDTLFFGQNAADSVVEECWNSAKQLIDEGNYEAAAEVLREGIEQTGSEVLRDKLAEVEKMLQSEPSASGTALLGVNDAQYRLNVFLTNFSQTKFYAYPCSDYEMLRFVREHCYYNNDGKIVSQNSRDYIEQKTVNDILYKYFAITLSEGSADRDYYSDDRTQSVRYSNLKYSYKTTPYAYNGYVAIAKTMQQDSYGYYTVTYDVYFVDSGYRSEREELYRLNVSEAQSHAHLSYAYSGEAVVQDYTRTNGKESYQLITLKITSTPKVFSEPAATYAPVTQTSGEVSLSSVQQRLNTFLTNFAETRFDTYPCTKYEMLSFAKTHIELNDDGEVFYSTHLAYVTGDTINDILYKYFGVTYSTNGSIAEFYSPSGNDMISYNGEAYCYQLAAGEGYSYVAIASDITRDSDGAYTVKYDVYSLVDFWEDDTADYYKYSSYQARNSIKLDYCYSGVARVKDYTRTNGVQSYQLLEMRRS